MFLWSDRLRVEKDFSDGKIVSRSVSGIMNKKLANVLIRSNEPDDVDSRCQRGRVKLVRASVARNRLFIFIQRAPDIAESSRNTASH